MDFSDIMGGSTPDIIEDEITEITDTNEMFEGELVRVDQTPTQTNWKLVPLFLDGIEGDVRVWQVGYNGGQIKMVTGALLNADVTPGELETTYHLSGPNPNQTCRLMYLNQYKEGYLPNGPELSANCNGSKPMLAKTYHHPSNPEPLKSNATRIKKYPISVMKKLNGIRGITKLRGNKLSIYSRMNNEFPHFQHIKSELVSFMRYLPPHCELDGELYSLNLGFEQLKSAVKTVKSVHHHYNKVRYFIFDIIETDKMSWEERYGMLVNAYVKYLEDGNTSNTFTILQSYNCTSSEDLDNYHDQFVKEGYEGVVIRRYASVESDKRLSLYRSGRTNSLVKYKNFNDEEVVIVGYSSEGKIIVKDMRGNQLEIGMKGPDQSCWLLSNPNVIGKQLTIRYSRLVDNVPLNPVGVTIRDYE